MSIVDEAKKAISAVHSDTSVSLEETKDRLEGLREDLEMLVEAVRDDIKFATGRTYFEREAEDEP